MEKNDNFNTNLLQLPMKVQVADEGYRISRPLQRPQTSLGE